MTRDQIQVELDKIADNYRLLGAILSKALDTDLIHDSAFLAQIDELKQVMVSYQDSIYSLNLTLNDNDKLSRGPRAKLRLVKG